MMRKLKVLSAFFLVLFLSSTFAVGLGMVSVPEGVSRTVENNSALAENPATDVNLRRSPVSILVFNQFIDSASGAPFNEYRNTITSIEETYGEKFRYDNLTDYTQLSSELSDYHVFLIPEQEWMSQENLTAVAAAWTGPLHDFVNDGGIVILLDCYNTGGLMAGGTSRIYNETGLLPVYNPVAGDAYTVYNVDTSDALSRGLAGSWSAADGSLVFNTTEGNTVVDDGTDSAVVHKIMGSGHIVLLGFDLFQREVNYDILLANSIRLNRHVVFDNSHNQERDIVTDMTDFALDLASQGFAVSSMDTFDESYLHASEVLVIPGAQSEYSADEVDFVEGYVASGGGLFLMSDWGHWGEVDMVLDRFGFARNETATLQDSDDQAGDASQIFYSDANILNHSVTLGVTRLENYYGTGFIGMPADAVPLIVTDTDPTATWDGVDSASGVVVSAALTHGNGRVIVLGDYNVADDFDYDGDTTNNYFDSNNGRFLSSAVRWLSAAGIEEKTVLFDASHGYNWFIELSYRGFADLLSANGYTVFWMSTFYEDFMHDNDVLLLEDGNVNYTAQEIDAIEAYVSGGGRLFILGGEGQWGLEADLVGNRFGLDLNNTGTIQDTDDFLVQNHYILYEEANFGNHPIMDGIQQFESYWASGFDSIGAATALITTDNDGSSLWSDGGLASGVPIMAAEDYGCGRVVFSADYHFPRYNYDGDSDGVNNLYEADNPLLILNIFYWLSENRAPIVEVTFPIGGEVLSGMVTVNWTASDPDCDPITIDVFYSDNNGTAWTPLATGLTVLEYEWNTTLHDDGIGYMIRVDVSDGILGSNDMSNAPFEIDNIPEPPGGLLIDPLLLVAIVGGALVIVIVIVLIMKKRGGGK